MTIVGRILRLADGPKSARQAAEAQKSLRALLQARDLARASGQAATLQRSVAELITRFLADCDARVTWGEMATETAHWYRMPLRFVPDALGRRIATELRPHDVLKFLDGHPTWNSTTRNAVTTAVKRFYNWAHKQGLIDSNPIAHLEKPQALRRTAVPSPKLAQLVLQHAGHPAFGRLLLVVYATGCRPKEARTVEAADLDLDAGVWRRAGKSTRRTRRDRVIALPAELIPMFRELAARHPEGPLLRNEDGEPWKPNALNCAMRRVRGRLQRAGHDPGQGTVLYALRHRFATDALLKGVPLATVATLMGHSRSRPEAGSRRSRSTARRGPAHGCNACGPSAHPAVSGRLVGAAAV